MSVDPSTPPPRQDAGPPSNPPTPSDPPGSAEEDLKRRQRMYWYRVTATFLLFSLLVAPASFHLDWYAKLTNHDPEWIAKALSKAPLYFFALTLCTEAYLRLEHYYELVYKNWWLYSLRLLLAIPVIVFILQYLVSPSYSSGAALTSREQWFQVVTGGVALLLSFAVHGVVTGQEVRRLE